MSPTTYEIGRGWVRLARGCGYFLALAAGAYLAGYVYDPSEVPFGLAVFGVLLFGGPAFLCIRLGHSPEVYAIEISDDGVRRTSSGAWIPWSGVVALRERPMLNRIDLIGPGGPTGITLEYQLDRFPEALDHVVSRVRTSTPDMPNRFRRPLLSWSRSLAVVITLGAVGLGAWVWLHEGAWSGPLLIVVMLGAFVGDSLSSIHSVTIADGLVSVRRGLRTTSYAVDTIASAKLGLRPIGNGNRYLDVFVEIDGKATPIRPMGADPFQLFTALQAEVEA